MVKCQNTTKKGRKLEDEVADIYRQLDGVKSVIQNTSIMGIQVDVYVEIETQDGVSSRYAIDAKNFDCSVNSDHVRKCINDFTVLRNGNKIDHGLVVSATDFTKDSHAAARETAGVTLMEIISNLLKALTISNLLQKFLSSLI
ncbi:MAG: restriction endonuclease [Deltaproteobacteria bacterium]|nr:restriction endonuclease [Deltaproteobacteria bacterium]